LQAHKNASKNGIMWEVLGARFVVGSAFYGVIELEDRNNQNSLEQMKLITFRSLFCSTG